MEAVAVAVVAAAAAAANNLEVEDDVFFADLSKRISLLIMDDDEDHSLPQKYYPSLPLQSIHPAIGMPSVGQQQRCNYTRSESKGTGVFIPSHPRRKNNTQGRHTKLHSHRHSADNSRGLPHHVPSNISNAPYDSIYTTPRRLI